MDKQDNSTNQPYPWGVCSVCIPRESFYWLRDWVDHHIRAGASKVVIYDNTGTTGSTRRSSIFCTGRFQKRQLSKRGEAYGQLTGHLSDDDIRRHLGEIASSYDDNRVEIVSWQPRHPKTGEIVHGQVEAYVDFIKRFKGELLWAAFLDMDEYLYCKPGLSVQKVIEQLEHSSRRISLLQLRAWRFECRWGENGPKDITGFSRHMPLKWGGEKNFVRLENITHANIHWDWKIEEGTFRAMADASDFGFCHYNQKPEQMEELFQLVRPRDFLASAPRQDLAVNLMRPLMPSGSELVAPMPVNI